MKAFTHLMFRSHVQSAVHFITDRIHSGGVLSLDASTGVPGRSVLDILIEKHPEPRIIDESPCDDLPPLLYLDITADYVEHVAHQLRDLRGLIDPLHCSGIDIFFSMVCPVHICTML